MVPLSLTTEQLSCSLRGAVLGPKLEVRREGGWRRARNRVEEKSNLQKEVAPWSPYPTPNLQSIPHQHLPTLDKYDSWLLDTKLNLELWVKLAKGEVLQTTKLWILSNCDNCHYGNYTVTRWWETTHTQGCDSLQWTVWSKKFLIYLQTLFLTGKYPLNSMPFLWEICPVWIYNFKNNIFV